MRRPPSRTSVLAGVVLLLAFVVWTWLVLTRPGVQSYDRSHVAAPIDPLSTGGQIASAFALLTWPGIAYAVVLGIAFWALQHRLRQLALGLALMTVLGWGGSVLLRFLIGRPTPDSASDLITIGNLGYPSSHLAAAVVLGIAISATLAVTRQPTSARFRWLIGTAALALLVAIDRWVTSASYISDLIGGGLFGAAIATLALLVAGVKVPVPHELVGELVRSRGAPTVVEAPKRRAAVIYNPAKVRDSVTFRRHVEYELSSRGWDKPVYLETSINDPGRAMTQQAVAAGVDLVLGAGGDGTIRVICAGLANTDIPFGLIPAGTGNLLARNIGIPLDEAAALDVAFDGLDKRVDLVRLSVDGGQDDHFAVMAGIGIDAVIMEGTDPNLKKAVGSAAYFVSAAQNANHPALHATIQVDDQPPLKRKAHVMVIGNVGLLQANIQLIPGARPDDGLLDVIVASPRTVRDWARIITQVLARRRGSDDDDALDRLVGRRVTITVEERDQYQLDGDTVGECSRLTAEVVPGALRLRVPRRPSEQPAPDVEAAQPAAEPAEGAVEPAVAAVSD